jgi:hypothetical protein
VRIETGGINQHVEFDLGPVRHDDAIRYNACDLSLDDVCIRELHRLVIVLVRFRDARAAEIIVGCELLLQLGVFRLWGMCRRRR